VSGPLTTLDYSVLAFYLLGITAFGVWRGGRQQTAQDYFLGRDRIPWWVVCFSIVAAETSALTFISIPGLAYLGNLTFLQVTFGYLLGRIAVSWVLLPAYYRGDLSTAYAFLGARFGSRTRSMASLVFLATRIAADGVRLFATAIPLKLVLGVEYPVAIAVLAAIALLYTCVGGVRGVIWVDAVQLGVYLGGAGVAVFLLLRGAEHGWREITQLSMTAGKWQLIDLGWGAGFWRRPYTLLAGLAGGALLSMASHGTDQLIVQRLLTTKSLRHGRLALVGSGVIIIFQFALFLVVGLLLYGHHQGASLAKLGLQRADEIFPRYIIEGLPPGLSGFIIAGLFAAALSTLAGSMSSMSSSTMLDLYRPHRGPNADAALELRISRAITVLWAGLLVGSAVFFTTTSQTVVELALSIASFTYGGLLGTFLLGLFSKRAREREALVAFAAGIAVMAVVISMKWVAWTWFTPVGVATTLTVGLAAVGLARRVRPAASAGARQPLDAPTREGVEHDS
jgi:solute:Na+ symporter, SSS family